MVIQSIFVSRQVVKMKQRALFAPEVFLMLDLTVCGLDIMAGRDIIVKLLGISVFLTLRTIHDSGLVTS